MSAPYFQDELVTLHHGDCIEVMRELPDNSVHAVVTDPPYGIGFMGHAWDQAGAYGALRAGGRPTPHARGRGRQIDLGRADAMEAGRYDQSPEAHKVFQEWVSVWSAECLRVLKPGGHMLVSGSPRTWHRLTSGIEDAGFEIRDSIAWLYGSGFPKSVNVAKAIAATELGHGGNSGAIRRAAMGDEYEPSGRRGNRDGNGRRDTGALGLEIPLTESAQVWVGWGTALKPGFEPIVVARKPLVGTVVQNVLAYGTGALNIDGARTPVADEQYARNHSSDRGHAGTRSDDVATSIHAGGGSASHEGRWPTNVVLDTSQAAALDEQSGTLTSGVLAAHHNRGPKTVGIYGAFDRVEGERGYGDSGGASRFFPTFRYEAKAPTSERPSVDGVQHPTVKPLDLMRWLVRLVTPAGGTVLEPFAGSGTTLEAALLEGFSVIGIEREADYLPLIMQRVSKPLQQSLFGGLE